MRIALVTDAWAPQVNGVVRTLSALATGLTAAGHEVLALTPDHFRTVPCPTDRAIRLAIPARRRFLRLIDAFAPETIHIATEGPLGLAARAYCVRRRRCFTTSFHTKFPEYLHARLGLPIALGYAALRWFHARSTAVMVATETVRRELLRRAFPRVVPWTRGVDCTLFRPDPPPAVLLPHRRRRTCPIFSTSICRDQSWSSATARCCRHSAAVIPKLVLPAGRMAKRWFATTPRRMFLCCRAGPRPLDWCCWRRLPADCRSRHCRCRARST
jgi:glycosyltransferase involved in cell wall biosynthesis